MHACPLINKNMPVAEQERAALQQLHVEIEEGDEEGDNLPGTCEVACSWLLTQASNIQVMPITLQGGTS